MFCKRSSASSAPAWRCTTSAAPQPRGCSGSASGSVTEAVLNHVSGTRAGVVGIYQRHDWSAEKRAALDAWVRHVLELAAGEADGGNVVPLPPSRAAG